jgi:hypothetical protein
MLAVRSHLGGVTVALALCLGTVAAVTYQGAERERAVHEAATRAAERSAALAIRDSQEALDKLNALMRELDAIEAEINELVERVKRAPPGSEEARRARAELMRVQQQRFERFRPVLDDRLIPRGHSRLRIIGAS